MWVTDQAPWFGADLSTASRHVKTLGGQGSVVRDKDTGDGRVARLALTTGGAEALERLRVARHRLFAEILADWPGPSSVCAPDGSPRPRVRGAGEHS